MRALILVDIQNDFVDGGALAVTDGAATAEVANRISGRFPLVVATQDWHPAEHASFAAQHEGREPGERIDLDGIEQILWPTHCVQGTFGAQFVDTLDRTPVRKVVQKGTDPRIDSYSGFFDNARRRETGLAEYLTGEGVREVSIMGLATDYCVKFTALDAVSLGFDCQLIEDGCRGVELQAGDVEAALAEMREAGVRCIRSESLL